MGGTLWCVAAGAAWTILRATLILAHGVPPALESKDVWVTGMVASIPTPAAHAVKFDFDVFTLRRGAKVYASPGRVRLGLYGDRWHPRVGERWRYRVRLKRPHGYQNPGGFDYEAWLLRRRIRATGYVRVDSGDRRMRDNPWDRPLDRLRARIARRIRADLGPDPYTGLLIALTTGYRGDISDAQWQDLLRTGTNHLVAISGLHIGLVAGLAFWLGRWLWSLWPAATLRWPAPKAGAAGALLAATAYAALAGFSIPTQRALVMVAVVMIAVMSQRRVPPTQLLATALLAVLVFDPLAPLAAGFWLSFVAVGVILLSTVGRIGRPGWLRRWGGVQLVLAVGLAPVVLFVYQRISLVAPAVNLVAVPVVGLLTVPLALGGVVAELVHLNGLATVLFHAAACVLALVWKLIAWAANLKFSVWPAPAPPLWALGTAALGLFWLLGPRGLPARWVGLVWLAPLIWLPPAVPASGAVWLTVLDVGEGLSAVVRTRSHTLVFDTGPRFSARFDAGRAVVVPYLRHLGIRRLDALVISQGDNDHIGGAASVQAAFPVERLLSGTPERLAGAAACLRGQQWRWDGVTFQVLNPPDLGRTDNNASCVVRAVGAFGAVLLTGDIEQDAEQRLVETDGNRLRAHVLVVPHHGSRTSSSPAFVARVDPAIAVIPVGYRNRYHHPHADVVARYRRRGTRLNTTARAGAITIRLTPAGVRKEAYRVTHRRYWFGR